MKPVNLLPDGDRPKKAVAVPANASAALVGGLAVLVLIMGVVVVTKNQIADRRSEITQAKQATDTAKSRAQTLQSFADFREVRQKREQSVSDLATQRFDWERFLRELALVLPAKVWLTDLNGSTGAADAASGSAPAAAGSASSGSTTSGSTTSGSSPAAGPGATAAVPSVKLSGCAPSHEAVATTLVRLRSIHSVDEVTLANSTSAKSKEGGDAAPTTQGAGETSGGAASGCTGFTFEVTVTFSSDANTKTNEPKAVPSRLGGGA